jgi:hypothetical protein
MDSVPPQEISNRRVRHCERSDPWNYQTPKAQISCVFGWMMIVHLL